MSGAGNKNKLEIPLAIRNVRLCSAFRGFTPGVEDSYTTTVSEKVMVCDDEVLKVSRFATEDDDLSNCFVALNQNKRQIVLLKIDNQLILSHEGGIADCALFDEKKFCFVEFKSNAQGNSVMAVMVTYAKAKSQLEETLDLFIEKCKMVNIDFTKQVDVECFIVTANSFPRISATEMNMAIAFSMKNRGVTLSFDGNTEF